MKINSKSNKEKKFDNNVIKKTNDNDDFFVVDTKKYDDCEQEKLFSSIERYQRAYNESYIVSRNTPTARKRPVKKIFNFLLLLFFFLLEYLL